MSVRYFCATIKAIEGDRVFWCEVPQLRKSINAIAGKVANDEAVYLDLWQWLQNDPNNQLVKSHWMVFLQYRSCMVTQRVYQNVGHRIDADYETLFYYQTFANLMQEQWRGPVSWRTATSFDATRVIIAGLRENPQRHGLQSQLRSSSFHQTGATGKISFDPNTGDRIGQPVLIQVRSTPSGEQFVALP